MPRARSQEMEYNLARQVSQVSFHSIHATDGFDGSGLFSCILKDSAIHSNFNFQFFVVSK